MPDPVRERAGAGPLRRRALWSLPADAIMQARGALFPFVPVALGLGIGLYFAAHAEPTRGGLTLLAGLALAGLVLGWRAEGALRPLIWALALVALGALLAALRTQAVAAPVLGWARYGPIEGRIVAVDRSGSDALRLTLDRVVLPGLPPARVPERVRVSIHGEPDDEPDLDPVAGTVVVLTGFLAPPGGPVEPGGFSFRRLAWFEGLGAVGYTRNPVLAVEDPGRALALTRLRYRLAEGIRARLPGEAGGFVAAILTGDRSGVGQDTLDDLRRSNLAHLLAISGLHMGLLTGVVCAALRGGMALIPVLALRWPIRKLAALGALAAGLAYLGLSGGNVATQRAFIMAAVMLIAVMVDRRAISIRSVAVAAVIVLALRPEALLSVGFHMSFAATVALVAVFRWLRDRRPGAARPRGWRRVLAGLSGAALCSLVAGLATAPYAAAQFHRVVDYGLLANIVSVPLMGALVMPAAVLAAVLWPVGLDGIGLWLMQLGTRWILFVADAVGGRDGAVTMVPAPPLWVIPALSLGAMWLILWPGRARHAGAVVAVAALTFWTGSERPPLLIEGEGALVGLMTPEGRALSRARGAGFVARNWLEADGDGASQDVAAARAGMQRVPGGARFTFGGSEWVHLTGQRGIAHLDAHCARGVTVVTDQRLEAPPPGDCRVIDRRALGRTGAMALWPDGRVVTAEALAGRRPWSGRR